MEKGLGFQGKAYSSNQPWLELDVKSYKKNDYLLDHTAHLNGLSATIDIFLQNIHTCNNEYISEFFYHLLV